MLHNVPNDLRMDQMSTLRSRMSNASAVWMVTGLLMVGSTLIVANSPQASAQKQTAQKAVSKPVSRPAASPRPGAGGSNVGGTAHGASSPGSKAGGPSANGRGTGAPSATAAPRSPEPLPECTQKMHSQAAPRRTLLHRGEALITLAAMAALFAREPTVE
jgi:hypothetical protein